MKNLLFAAVIVLISCCSLLAKNPLCKVSITLNDGTVINGFCEDMFKHERPIIKLSPQSDGKKSVKYPASDIKELRYEVPNDTTIEYWYPVPYYHSKTLMMKRVRQHGTITLWTACIGGQELTGPQGMRWTERVKNCISFGTDMADGTAWDLPHIINGRCKELPNYGDFVKNYKESHPNIKDWTETVPLMDMCKAYVDYIIVK
jgi:hypothetical protein